MINKNSRFLMLAMAFIAGCSVHENLIYSAVEINGEPVSKWPFSNYGVQLHIRADNTQAIHSTSRVMGIPIQTVEGAHVASIRPHTIFIAIKAKPTEVVAWEPAQLVLFHNNMEVRLSEISYPKLIAYDADCMEVSGTPAGAVAIHDEYYLCVKAVFDVDTIAPTENFQLKLSGLFVNGKPLTPMLINFKGSERKLVLM
ncbi:hypothetical protein [Alkalimonas amylolytica]|uniref:Uncharacterized protein n=1 Tax=Alkalimonas amylolytica TaxID=152573 RepID=A0A1H4G5S1_ALKAM|nr:hypothetical protein [Alkalimonas amylolytica]SEB04777.1 hypothetical protein SAMN04488051_1202 [Alkalimonas amylolytica]